MVCVRDSKRAFFLYAVIVYSLTYRHWKTPYSNPGHALSFKSSYSFEYNLFSQWFYFLCGVYFFGNRESNPVPIFFLLPDILLQDSRHAGVCALTPHVCREWLATGENPAPRGPRQNTRPWDPAGQGQRPRGQVRASHVYATPPQPGAAGEGDGRVGGESGASQGSHHEDR